MFGNIKFVVASVLVLSTLFIISCASTQMVDPSRRQNIPDEKKVVVFRSDIDESGNYEIYALRADKKEMDPDGSLVKRLTNTPSPAMEVFPTIARDADTVVYCSSENDLGGNPFFPDFDLFMVKISTGEKTPLTDTGREREYAPSLSGDGKTLTFMVDSFGRQAGDLYMVNMDKPTERKLIQENLSRRAFPHVSADGKFVIYSAPAGQTKKMDIFILNLETRDIMNISRTPDLEEVYPDFSDDRKIIVFELKDGEEKAAPETPPTGQAPPEKPGAEKKETEKPAESQPSESQSGSGNDGGTRMLGEGTAPEKPAEKPSGDKSAGEATKPAESEAPKAEPETKPEPPKAPPAAQTSEEGDWEIWMMNVQSGKKQKLTDNTYQDMFPIISGDGTWVVYTSARQDFNDDNQNEFMVYLLDLLTMKEEQISTMPFHHDTIEISW